VVIRVINVDSTLIAEIPLVGDVTVLKSNIPCPRCTVDRYYKYHSNASRAKTNESVYKPCALVLRVSQAEVKAVGKCKICSVVIETKYKKAKPVAHHLQSKALYPHLALDVDNGITLCWACHIQHHSEHKLERTHPITGAIALGDRLWD
jgi:5-methylcytosine-specific restriction endonuclease McrA